MAAPTVAPVDPSTSYGGKGRQSDGFYIHITTRYSPCRESYLSTETLRDLDTVTVGFRGFHSLGKM